MDISKTFTDDTLRETVTHGTSSYPFAYYPEDIWQFDFHRIDWHWHNELEMLFVSEGELICLVGADRIELQKGCAVFINSGVLHRFEAKASVFVPNIVFSPTLIADEDTLIYQKYIDPILHSSVMYQVFEPHIGWQARVIQLLQQIISLQNTGDTQEFNTLRTLMDIWDLLFQNLNLTAEDYSFRRLNSQQAKLQTMMQYIHDHYAEEVTLEGIAASAFMSKSGALHIFQSLLHTAPVTYLIQYRLAKAAEQLQTTQNTISAIASNTGFVSTGYFCRQFRRHYGMSATEYRKKDCSFVRCKQAINVIPQSEEKEAPRSVDFHSRT